MFFPHHRPYWLDITLFLSHYFYFEVLTISQGKANGCQKLDLTQARRQFALRYGTVFQNENGEEETKQCRAKVELWVLDAKSFCWLLNFGFQVCKFYDANGLL